VISAVLECHLNTKSGQFELAGIGKLAEKQFNMMLAGHAYRVAHKVIALGANKKPFLIIAENF
jgi:hypothetical protein